MYIAQSKKQYAKFIKYKNWPNKLVPRDKTFIMEGVGMDPIQERNGITPLSLSLSLSLSLLHLPRKLFSKGNL